MNYNQKYSILTKVQRELFKRKLNNPCHNKAVSYKRERSNHNLGKDQEEVLLGGVNLTEIFLRRGLSRRRRRSGRRL